MPSKTPKPDDYGRIRVQIDDVEPKVDVTINATGYGDGEGMTLLPDEPASDRAGDPIPESLSSNRGQSAESKKEKS